MTSEQIEKIAWLNRAFHAEKKVSALEYHVRRDNERAQRITANCGGNTKGKSDSRSNGVEEALMILAESEGKYIAALGEYNLIRRETELAIESLHDAELEALFIYRYLEYKSMSEIAELMNYERTTIHRKHKKGLEKLQHNAIECNT